ncbi:MAG: glycosyltransferase family protein, partial [Clostridia bacterium]
RSRRAPPAAEALTMPVVLSYVQHLLGIGHLMRARLVAEAVAGAGFDVHLVSGGRPVGGPPPSGVRTVQLPPVHATGPGMKPLRAPDGQPIDDAYRRRRCELLLAEFESVAPDVVIFETFPFGRRALHFELLPLLERIAMARPRPLVVASVRDILQQRSNAERLREMLELARASFDAVLVHGDPRFARFEETFPLAAELGLPVHYTGFVAAPGAPRLPGQLDARSEIVVSAGGGTVGMRLLQAALAAQKRSRYRAQPWRVLAGTNVAETEVRQLARTAESNVVVERSRTDFPALLNRALVSVSQAGYNTVLDVLRSGARPVLVPYAEAGETEQRARASRLRELDLAVVVDGAEDLPAALAAAIDAAGSRERWGPWDLDCDGAARSAALIKDMLQRGGGRRAAASR